MPVNTTATASNYALNVGAIGVVGTFIGMPLDALILGAFAGAAAHGLNRAGKRSNGMATIIAGTLLAGAFSPAVVGWLVHYFDFGDTESETAMLKPLVPVLIGAAWPWLMAMISDGLKQVWAAFVGRVVKLIEFFGGDR
ncbi:hypothetical protein [Neisseria musculi]|uniref:Uncharacterized protein n=1 Tax=Neisseria musculi TaxID=1815583 RepID=A0A7H1MFC2_9NEIS|nr:hypothetical protein [Neisseria musculi]QNT60337.1 hypothetical protein H7A79_1612 [Neisseria musculi]